MLNAALFQERINLNDFNVIRILRQFGQRGAGSAISTVVIKRNIMVSNPGE
jgi:hypothetical protein